MGPYIISSAFYFEVVVLVLKDFENVYLRLISGSMGFKMAKHAPIPITSWHFVVVILLPIGVTQSNINLLVIFMFVVDQRERASLGLECVVAPIVIIILFLNTVFYTHVLADIFCLDLHAGVLVGTHDLRLEPG